MVESSGVRDYDYHPHESFARQFSSCAAAVRRLDDTVLVTDALYPGDVILRHYAFASRWIKVNVTFTTGGELVETGPGPPSFSTFSFNCDIATPMRRDGHNVFAVDLFLDVLVRADAHTYLVTDEGAFDEAAAAGLISVREASSARRELKAFVTLVESGGLLPWLNSVCPIGPSSPPPASAMIRVPVPSELQRETRWTW